MPHESTLVQVKARIPRDWRRRVYVAFAEHEEKCAPWLRHQRETGLKEVKSAG